MIGSRFFYGWWIVAAGFGLEMLIGGLVFHAYGAYVVLLREEFGWSKTLFSAAFSMARAESGLLGPVQGWLTDRFGPRALIRAGMVIFASGLMLFSQITSPVTFFLTFFMMALGSSLGGYLPIGVAVVRWFRRRRAFALSISATGMGVGRLLTPLVVVALTRLGWRWTAFLSGLFVLAVGLPLAQLVRDHPERHGLLPDGDTRPPELPAAGVSAAPADHLARRAGAREVGETQAKNVRADAFGVQRHVDDAGTVAPQGDERAGERGRFRDHRVAHVEKCAERHRERMTGAVRDDDVLEWHLEPLEQLVLVHDELADLDADPRHHQSSRPWGDCRQRGQ